METQILCTPTLPTFFFLFLFLYLFAYFVVFNNWAKHKAEASSCLISLAHGTPAVLLALRAILKTHKKYSTFDSPNTTSHNTVLEFSIAYFLLDLLHYIIFFPNDILFILHHLATLYVFATCRYVVQNGAFALLVLLVLAEITSGCQNVWTLSSLRKANESFSAKLHVFLSPWFYAFYSVFRGVLGPIFVFKMSVFYVNGMVDDLIPKWAWISWMVVIVTAIFASIMWVLNLWVIWFKERSYKAEKVSFN